MKLKVFSSFLIFLLMIPNVSMFVSASEKNGNSNEPENSEPNWQMTWNDEFEGDELDTSKWRIDIGNGFYNEGEWIEGWGNNELQSYQEDNVRVEDGRLILEAREETVSDEHGEYDYTSGKVLTDESFSQAYGRFEASMKLPEGQGYWPAFWMMPQDDVYGGWAASGEIDIMENRGSETNKVGAAIHYGDLWPNNTYSEEVYVFPEGQSTTDFNEYAIEWEPGEIRWYVNDELYSTKTEWGTANGEYPAPFDQEFHMILNLAVGGWYGGEPDETTEFPGQVEVEYVRVYEDADAEHPPPGEPSDPAEPGEINWQMTWNDEFDGDELDLDKWRIDIGNGFYSGDEWIEGWGNNESQSYQEDNVWVEDGRLILEAREETVSDEHGEYDYTSGKVLTDESFSQAYGRFEASMKLPEGQGYWPAFWMMPQDDVYGGWAASGEIDIMENRGSETNKVGAAIHYGDLWPNNTYSAKDYYFPEGQSTTDFNEYAIEWEPGEIRWYVNDELYSTKTEWGTKYGEYPAPFDQEFFMILNLAVGGWYGGEPDETTEFPGRVEVEYVRVYEDADAEHPPPGEWIDPGDGDEPGDGETPPVDETKNWVEVGDNLIEDGTFETTTEFGDENNRLVWNIFNMGKYDRNAGLADFSIENEVLKATVRQVGWAWWHMQLMQDVTVPSGTYKVEFDMKSEQERTVRVELVGSESGILDFEVGDTMETYTGYLNVKEDGDYHIMFGLGRGENDPQLDVPYDIFIDNVRLVEVVEEEESEEPLTAAEMLEELEKVMNEYVESGDVRGPLVNQLENTLRQAQHHESAGRYEQAAKFMDNYLKHLNRGPNKRHVEDEAKLDLTEHAEKIMGQLKETE
ncbi:glycoside hydrolase family 16 protein [Salipaludibacillus aurantiacus]|uniref:Beta-glucanase, GH16 family n=1 Tax=Salipaludibacillus aurantiacus TaxID=1601833 RepID=A0A1H9TX22_9BACI|nr:glycoside hydrolase family 16 protein [Salipaludibacillus aurantiacus]SES01676.1 Beta-glucanase, GH16 family [Salipaludibacillus aurantiacus]